MNDEQLTRLFRSLDELVEPDADFGEALFARLERERVAGIRRLPLRWALVAAALLATAAIGSALVLGGGVKVPSQVVIASPTAQPTQDVIASPTAQPTPTITSSGSSPMPSPAAGVAFQLAYGRGGDIYLADWDGRNSVRIADGDSAATVGCRGYDGPQWSPNGRYVSYRSSWGDVCPGTVAISDANGQPVASFPGSGWSVAWSPDSTRVATWVALNETIGVYGLDGERQALLTVPAELVQCGDCDPVWEPDGRLMVPPDVEVPLDGSAPRHLPAFLDRLGWWSVSRDGTRVAYVTRDNELEVTAVDGSDPRRLFSGGSAHPIHGWSLIWSPGGDRVAFAQGAGFDYWGTVDMSVVDVASGAITSLSDSREDQPQLIGFSPDGDKILFATSTDADGILWSIAANGSEPPQRLVESSHLGDWQPVAR